jgi:hypothetical protein
VYVGGELTVLDRKPVRQEFAKISGEVWKRVTRLKPPPGFETPTLSSVSPQRSAR